MSRSAPTLGIIGGGQLARMTAMAALQLGCQTVILERQKENPASSLATHSLVGDWNELSDLRRLAALSDVVTLENEFVDANLLAHLEAEGVLVRPGAHTMRLIQDKFVQKQTLAEAGVRVPRFLAVTRKDQIKSAGDHLGWPLVLKARRNGYDGKGNATLRSPADIDGAWAALDGERNPLYLEEFCHFAAELAVIITRAADGHMVSYPVVESVQRNHICHEVYAPAQFPHEVIERAQELATGAISAVQGIGSFGVEMFLLDTGEVLLNELAPRVHNSGHYSIEGCLCSQFENHVRAVMNWPLGSTRMSAPAAVMINLLGAGKGSGIPAGLTRALAVPGAHVHLYGKSTSSPGRKMGHLTALGATLEEARQTAKLAADHIRFGN